MMQTRMHGRLLNLRSALKRASRHSITHGGLLFTVTMLMVGIAAVVSANNLLFLIAAAMMSTLMVSGVISGLSLAGLELDFIVPEHVAARRTLGGRIDIHNAKALLPSFSVHLTGTEESLLTRLYFPVIPAKTVLEEPVELWFRKRGVYRENGFQFSTGFPFGFLERRAQVTLRRDILVYPCLDPQPGFEELVAAVRGDLETQYRGRGHDFYRIRPYEALESARHVDWKATAHTGALQVREFAREQERLLEIFLDLNAAGAEQAWFEQAVEAAAFLAWRMAARDSRLRFRTQDFDVPIPEGGDVYVILKYLATVAPASGKAPLSPEDDDSCQIVFTAADPETMARAGWHQARIIGPGDFAAAGADSAEPARP
jgi:uncharacterized protein (DUF58 family)